MQTRIRTQGEPVMKKSLYEIFTRAYAENMLVKPEDCGHVIAALVLQAPKNFSGEFVSWDSKDCKPFMMERS